MSHPPWCWKWLIFRWLYHSHTTLTSMACQQLLTMAKLFVNVVEFSNNCSSINVALTCAEIQAHVTTTVLYTYSFYQFRYADNPMMSRNTRHKTI